MKKIISLICIIAIMATMGSFVLTNAGAPEYETKGNGFDSYAKASVALLYRKGIKTINTSKVAMPSGITNTIKITPVDNAYEDGCLELASSRNPDTTAARDFINGVKIDAGVGGKTYNLFGDARLMDSEGIRIYLAAEKNGNIQNLKGSVKFQYSKSNTRGLNKDETYIDMEQGFVFETPEYEIGEDGYVIIGYDNVKCVDTWTDYQGDFEGIYLPQIDVVNIIITPDDKIESSDVFYIGDMHIVRKYAENYINVEDGYGCSGIFDLIGRTMNGETVEIKLDGADIPIFCEKSNYTDSYGQNSVKYVIDTQLFGSGRHTLDLYVDGKFVLSNKVYFDNDQPYVLSSSITDGQFTESSGTIDLQFADDTSGVDGFSVKLDGQKIRLPYDYENLQFGTHVIEYRITDKSGNTVNDSMMFTVSKISTISEKNANYNLVNNGTSTEFSIYSDTADWYSINKISGMLNVKTSRNVVSYDKFDDKQVDGEQPLSSSYYSYYSSRDSKYPYLAYDVDVSDIQGDYFNVSYSGKTMSGEAVRMDVYNEELECWDRVVSCRAGKDGMISMTGKVLLKDHTLNGTARVRVSLMYTDNGAKAIGWASDQQYYVEHDEWGGDTTINRDLSFYFKDQVAQLVADYKSGKIGYIVNTGDTANNMNKESQFQEVREILNEYDENQVPYGILAGNHEVWKPNFKYWQKYFGSKWFNQNDWYGGGINDNINHYDLVTIAGHDLIFIYIGWSDETTPETVQWVKDVMDTYKHRTAIMCFHGYISNNTEFVTEYVTAEDFWHQLVEPYSNIKMVLCGHEPGVAHNIRIASDGRKVNEILQCYQMDPEKWYNWRDGGWGLYRYISFDEISITNETHTADKDYDKNYYWREEDENFSMQMSYIENNRLLESYSFVAYTGAMEKIADASKKSDGSFTALVNDSDEIELWCAESNDGFSAVYPISVKAEKTVSSLPKIAVATAENGKLHLMWQLPFFTGENLGYKININGNETTVSKDEMTYDAVFEPNAGEKYVVFVTLITSNGRLKSENKTIIMGGAPKFDPMDIDEDGTVTVADALAALRVAAKLTQFDNAKQWCAANCDGDIMITVADALAILRKAAKLV